MNFNTVLRTTVALFLCAVTAPSWAINISVPGIHGDISRTLLGDGTGIIVGVIDSGVDDTHPSLAGNDSLGNPRLVAEQNFVPTEPGNTGDDIFGHGTVVASIALSSDSFYRGMAPDARYVNARVLDNGGGFNDDMQVRNGVGFAIDQGANVLNLSMNYFAALSGGYTQLDLMVDWAAYSRGISSSLSVGNISQGPGTDAVRDPGGAFNGITVGRVINDLSKVSIDSAGSYTEDGRMKPDVVAPGTLITAANNNWETGSLWRTGLNGTSFAVPHVSGLIAQELDAGKVARLEHRSARREGHDHEQHDEEGAGANVSAVGAGEHEQRGRRGDDHASARSAVGRGLDRRLGACAVSIWPATRAGPRSATSAGT